MVLLSELKIMMLGSYRALLEKKRERGGGSTKEQSAEKKATSYVLVR